MRLISFDPASRMQCMEKLRMTDMENHKGRPSTYTPEIAAAICERLADGESLRAICRDSGMPDERTVRRWAVDDVQGFSPRYARARDIGLDAMADELLEIADTPREGVRIEKSEAGYKEIREDMLGHRKLQIDTRKWYLSKLAPKKYGDLQRIEHSGTLDVAQTILAARKRSGGQ